MSYERSRAVLACTSDFTSPEPGIALIFIVGLQSILSFIFQVVASLLLLVLLILLVPHWKKSCSLKLG